MPATRRQLVAKQHQNFKKEATGRKVPAYLTEALLRAADSDCAIAKLPTNGFLCWQMHFRSTVRTGLAGYCGLAALQTTLLFLFFKSTNL